MKEIKEYSLLIMSLCIIVFFTECKSNSSPGEIVFIENGKIKLGFEKETGKFISFSDVGHSYEFIERNMVKGLPWEVNFHSSSAGSESSSGIFPTKFSFSKSNELTLNLEWEGFEGMKELKVKAEVSLDPDKALSYWSIKAEGIKGNLIKSIDFPRIQGIKNLGDEELAIPTWMGSLVKNPRESLAASNAKVKRWSWSYPGSLSMQLIALYNPNLTGFYASCNDSLSFAKDFAVTLDTLNTLEYKMINYPTFDSTLTSYHSSYKAIIGSFKGDWITAAELYREWGTKQKWCDNSRLKNELSPSWLDSTALWIWNRGKSDNVLTPAVELKQKLGLPVNVFWHWWHHCSYDDYFPEYFPPREGRKSFKNAVKSAQEEGVRCIVYMNSIQWGDSSGSWKTEGAQPYSVKDINGKMRSHAYNIFTGNSLTNMCMATEFWKNKYSSLCDSAVNVYQTNGVYMDQACLSRMCFDKSHGHKIGGGNYWVENFGNLTQQIRATVSDKTQPILAGEGSGENWIPYLDAFLTLPVSRERYAGVTNTETIPFFQAVYHEYALTYGSYSSLVTPPYDELWPKEYAPKETEQLLDADFNKQFLMEQARAFVWGMQPTIANYHSFLNSERAEEINYLLDIAKLRYQALKYLLYGEFCRSPQIDYPEEEIKISKLSIYAGRKGKSVTTFNKKVSLLYSGTWKAKDNSVGIALASISDDTLPVHFSINSEDYKLSDKGKIYIRTTNGKELLGSYSNGLINVEISLQPKGICIVEIVPSV
ncbi:hypothetical protein SAMN05444274_1248 [Mariniphaga anaerophila]|uniref:DUF6259 domain-containing protein n=1 Tax=Mariniphaga anaerophila TaxID=1484053 RepID=A0A1M5GJ33_9BACT|nr:DUF6259 domain-containing protein [Mariniphaga anaerophila]SHG03754.1 hypothetical protein SAMN05444274_1248 [Mariniphaga anaerophila]